MGLSFSGPLRGWSRHTSNKIPGKNRIRGTILNPPGGLRDRDLFGLGVERRVDQENGREKRSSQKSITVLMCFNHVFER